MDAYQFSKVHRATCISYSPGSTFIATAVIDQILVRTTSTLECVRSWTCTLGDPSDSHNLEAPSIDHLEWSPGGSQVLAFSSATGVVWVFDLAQDGVVARIAGNVVKAEWGEEDVLTQSERVSALYTTEPADFKGIALYNISSAHSRFIQNVHGGRSNSVPIHMLTAGHAWSPDRRYLAVSERHSGKQYVGVYDKETIIRVCDHGVQEHTLSSAL